MIDLPDELSPEITGKMGRSCRDQSQRSGNAPPTRQPFHWKDSSSFRACRSSDSLLRRRFSLRLRAELHELITSAEKRNATVVGTSRTLNSNAKNGSVKKKLIDNVDSKTANSPGPVPPNHVASSTAGKKRETRTPKSCSGNVTAVQIATDKIERPYRHMAGATRRKPRSDFDILLTPKVYVRRSALERLTIKR